ncbi:hypothetical protein [Lactobacillus corticis]|uniref:Bacteriocin-associated integral membrane protein n=1 Tax=Lactobacillus corticis TaxID=2201249 RepID=A0A916VH90_9LACO|nr:hypothetical protein [Lactobacillus corticis]GFZ26372.1 hypothetical protein LCB40_02520 [Lactobacillus corticis]
MYKKVLKLILVGVNIFMAFLVMFYFTENYADQRIYQEADVTSQYTQLGLPNEADSTKEYLRQLKVIRKTSAQLSVPFIRRTSYAGAGRDYRHYRYDTNYQQIIFEVSDFNKSLLGENFNRTFHNGQVYSTKKRRQAKKLQKYGAVDFTVENFSKNSAPVSRKGIFFIQTDDPAVVRRFYRNLRYNYNLEFSSHYQLQDFKPEALYSTDDLLDLNDNELYQLTVTIVIFQLVFFVLYCMAFIYDIGVYQLLGMTTSEILQQIILPELLWGSIPPMIISVIYELLKGFNSIIWFNIRTVGLIILLEYSFAFLLTKIMEKVPKDRIVVKQAYYKSFFKLAFAAKGILLFFVLTNITPVVQLGYSLLTTNDNVVYHGYASYFPVETGYAQVQSPYDSGQRELKYLYPKLNRDGALFIDTSSMLAKNSYWQRGADVNMNYLRFNPILKADGKKVALTEDDPLTLLIPQKYHAHLKQIVAGADKVKKQVIWIKSNQPIYNTEGRKIKDYRYIAVLSQKYLKEVRVLNAFTGSAADTIKIPLKGRTTKQLYRQYLPILAKYELSDEIPNMIRADQTRRAELQSEAGDAKEDWLVILLSLMIYLLITITMIYLYLAVYGREVAIKLTLGISPLKAERNYWLLWLIQLVVVLGFTKVYGTKMPLTLAELLFAATVAADFVISQLGLRIFTKKAMAKFLDE